MMEPKDEDGGGRWTQEGGGTGDWDLGFKMLKSKTRRLAGWGESQTNHTMTINASSGGFQTGDLGWEEGDLVHVTSRWILQTEHNLLLVK